MTSAKKLFDDPLPPELTGARLGSVFDSRLADLDISRYAVDLAAANAKGMIIFDTGHHESYFVAQADSKDTANSWFWGAKGQASGGWPAAKASLGFSVKNIESREENTTTTTSEFINAFRGQSLRLVNFGGAGYTDATYSVMRPQFQTAYDKVMKAPNPAAALAAYNNLTKKFGTGIVTKLDLTAISTCSIHIKRTSEKSSEKMEYAGEAAAATPWGGGSAAAKKGSEVKKIDSGATVTADFHARPPGNPTSAWAQALATTLRTKGLDALASDSTYAHLPEPSDPKPPALPEVTPKEKKAPKRKEVEDISGDLKAQFMKEDGYDDMSWDAYLKAQKELYEKLTAENVAEEASANASQPASTKSLSVLAREADEQLASSGMTERRAAIARALAAAEQTYSLGGYFPIGFEVTPWEEIFPELSIPRISSFSSLYAAKLAIYMYTRIQFLDYLQFLQTTDLFDSTDTQKLNSDINYYNQQLFHNTTGLAAIINSKLDLIDLGESKHLSNSDFRQICDAFETAMRSSRFYGKGIYDRFFSQYEEFTRARFGYVLHIKTVKDNYRSGYYSDNMPWVEASPNGSYGSSSARYVMKGSATPGQGLTGGALERAIRFFPILFYDGSTDLAYFVYYGRLLSSNSEYRFVRCGKDWSGPDFLGPFTNSNVQIDDGRTVSATLKSEPEGTGDLMHDSIPNSRHTVGRFSRPEPKTNTLRDIEELSALKIGWGYYLYGPSTGVWAPEFLQTPFVENNPINFIPIGDETFDGFDMTTIKMRGGATLFRKMPFDQTKLLYDDSPAPDSTN